MWAGPTASLARVLGPNDAFICTQTASYQRPLHGGLHPHRGRGPPPAERWRAPGCTPSSPPSQCWGTQAGISSPQSERKSRLKWLIFSDEQCFGQDNVNALFFFLRSPSSKESFSPGHWKEGLGSLIHVTPVVTGALGLLATAGRTKPGLGQTCDELCVLGPRLGSATPFSRRPGQVAPSQSGEGFDPGPFRGEGRL